MFKNKRRHFYGVSQRMHFVIANDRLLARKLREHLRDDTQFECYADDWDFLGDFLHETI